LKYGFGDIQQAQGSIARVLTWLENHTGVHQFQRVPVNLTDGAHFSPNQSGLTNWRFDGYRLDVDVEMLRYSQANTFEPTLAHEYGHVLLVANPNDLSFTGGMGQARLQEEEGFCEVLRYLWISETGGSNKHLELQAIKDNRDSLYGDGFRMMWPEFKSAGSIMNLRAPMRPRTQVLGSLERRRHRNSRQLQTQCNHQVHLRHRLSQRRNQAL
jgi:hypothetical protein